LLRAGSLDGVPGVVHGFTTREGGVSQGPWESLNLGLRVGDDRAAVARNRATVLAALGREDGVWVSAHQVHGDQVVEVTRRVGKSLEADGLWTRDRAVVLAVLVADCVPILVADEKGTAVAAVHAGWRGSRDRIAARLVKRMQAEGFAPESLRVAIGPAIGPCCFEIGDDVAAELAGAVSAPGGVSVGPNGKARADLWAINRQILVDAGVRDAAIDLFRVCTSCRNDFFSHRRDHGECGRQVGVIGLGPVS
jgi:hypothetical protein